MLTATWPCCILWSTARRCCFLRSSNDVHWRVSSSLMSDVVEKTSTRRRSRIPCIVVKKITVSVQISSATRDLMLIQQNKFYWISSRSGVAELVWTVTKITTRRRECVGFVVEKNEESRRTFQQKFMWFTYSNNARSVSCHGNRHPIPANRAPAVTMTGDMCHCNGLWLMGATGKMASVCRRFVMWRSVFLFFN